MSIPGIHVHTQADKSTVPYAKFMWETMTSLANRPELLSITVHCMGPTAAARSEPWVQRGKALVVTSRRGGDPLNGSNGHGACVMSALGETGDGDIHIICDSDTVIVAKGWDDYLRRRLIDDEIGIVGSTYEDVGGLSSGASSVQTYKKIPTLTWCALSPMHNWRDLNVMPNKNHQVGITNAQLSKIYNLPEGYSIFGEVGWQIPQYLHDHALKYEGWRQLKSSRSAVILKGLSDYHEEFHIDDGDIPIVAHHRGSMRHAYRGDKISKQFYATIDNYVAGEMAKPPRWKWEDSGREMPKFASAPAPVAPPPAATTVEAPEFVPTGKEWLKLSFNGAVIRARKGVDRNQPSVVINISPPGVDRIGHLRVEGVLEHNYPIVLPAVDAIPYMITMRNATGAPLLAGCGRSATCAVPPGKTWWLLVDVDGVQHVE